MMKSVHMVMSLLKIDYTEIFHIRCGYEYTALKLAMEVATEEELEKLHEVLVQMDQPMSVKERTKLDVKFHWEIYYALLEKDYAAGRAALEKHFEIVEEHVIKIEGKIEE